AIVAKVRAAFDFAADAEIAIEMDPRTFSAEKARALAEMGFNRGSFGVQDFNETVQKLVNRIQPYEMVARCVEDLRAAGIVNVNFDLMYGLPGQTVDSVVETARMAAGLRPDRIAVFGYAHVPWFKRHQRMIRDEDLPDIDARYEQAIAIGRTLTENGYVAVGLDHYARNDDPLARALADGTLRRNFQGYTVDPADALLGFGCSAISSLPQGYAQSSRDMARWASAIDEGRLTIDRGLALDDEDRMRAEIIERLMCFLRVRPAEVAAAHGFAPETLADAWEKLAALEADGLCRVEDGEVIVPEDRRLFVRTVAAAFDVYYRPVPNRHAKAV
ncbi:MAG TPA: coproporphyrinogen dehydrogenase, partial [Thermopetrobacter sp.]|nr:coproporphyrinogen dehydrogenase [Thermopetrobacter sp.]